MTDIGALLQGTNDRLDGLPDKLASQFREAAQIAEYERARTVKWMRLPEMWAVVASSAISIGEEHGQYVGPEQGYVWAVRRLVVDGLTSGSTPDVVNLYRTSNVETQPPLWQFNGNNFGYTFGKGELTLFDGDTFNLTNVGTIAATGTIRLSGEVVQVAAERYGDYLK